MTQQDLGQPRKNIERIFVAKEDALLIDNLASISPGVFVSANLVGPTKERVVVYVTAFNLSWSKKKLTPLACHDCLKVSGKVEASKIVAKKKGGSKEACRHEELHDMDEGYAATSLFIELFCMYISGDFILP
ncbi:uncharacterized protein G2W53_034287 [Senna tora]|uniref:Uncharacterized protein n=1 Tax=Senna tora TaxID=362788 RepID=A0A834T122_9FABA|nr:uncharacterized protein G2W53_034287 [Senna tora]